MDWLNVGKAALGGLTSLFGTVSNNKNIDKQIAAQKEENRLNREYNLMLAKQQNEWNLEQWNRENAYNDPSAQMQRLRTAGLNPDLVYGSGSAANLSAASPEMTSGAASQPVDMSAYRNRQTIADTIAKAQQFSAVEVATEKAKSEATGQKLKNIEQESQNVIRSFDAKYHSDMLSAEYQNLVDTHHRNNEQLELLRSQVANIDEETLSKSIDNDFKEFYKSDYYRYLQNQYKISDEDVKRAQAMTNALIRSANAKADYDEDLANFNARVHEQDLKLDDLLVEVSGETGYAKLFSAILRQLLRSFSK